MRILDFKKPSYRTRKSPKEGIGEVWLIGLWKTTYEENFIIIITCSDSAFINKTYLDRNLCFFIKDL